MVKVWIGRKESDIISYDSKIFDYSITYYGSNKFPNYSFITDKRVCAKYNKFFCQYIINCINEIKRKHFECELYFYNSSLGEKLLTIDSSLKSSFRNCNSFGLLNWLNNKSYVRLWLSNSIQVPPFTLFSKADCNFEKLQKKIPGFNNFIIQYNYSSGGTGTFLLNKNNNNDIFQKLSCHLPYLVSPYIEDAYSACCHVIITNKDCIIFPIGLQVLSNDMDYNGTTYILPNIIKKSLSQINQFIFFISMQLAQNGYRGICGYDFLIKQKELILIEINPRFMGSSYLINKVLYENGLPSLFEFNSMAFQNDDSIFTYKKTIQNLHIPYTSYAVHFDENNIISSYPECYCVFKDGHNFSYPCENGAYMYSYIIKNN